MATKNEKTLATLILTLMADLDKKGMPVDSEIKGNMRYLIDEILNEDTTIGTKRDPNESNNFFYSGIEFTTMDNEARSAELQKRGAKVCEFTVKFRGEIILRVYWDKTLNWIMQPKENGGFRAVERKKFPCAQGSSRPFLKKLAEDELENPGAFAKKYYAEDPIDVD